ncbi:SCO family protein [Halalkalibacterium halodurans]|uniref:SCO family protein n=1 Tax=Halalkalibacterium halodurans TaxID=86665 RepID=UPI00106873CB|nr:SCO family protein [Halalkalibacterium halodurans]TES57692.1 SCO family protein [Halalkalibacterium halodurans]
MKHFFSLLGLLLILSGCGLLYSIGGSATSDFDLSESGMAVPEFEFTNHYGEQYGSEDLNGQYWLAKMVFTNCPTVCPILTPNMINLQDAMIDEGVEMKFISFTVDPERDTSEHLRKYGQNIGAKEGYWYFLTGYDFEDFQNFSLEAFNSPVENLVDSDDIMHSTRFFLVDPEGHVIRGYDGMTTDQTDIIKDLIETVNE